jgi:hypothetical protein
MQTELPDQSRPISRQCATDPVMTRPDHAPCISFHQEAALQCSAFVTYGLCKCLTACFSTSASETSTDSMGNLDNWYTCSSPSATRTQLRDTEVYAWRGGSPSRFRHTFIHGTVRFHDYSDGSGQDNITCYRWE